MNENWAAGILKTETRELRRENAVAGLNEVFTLQETSRALAVKEKELAAQVKTSWAESVAKIKELVENGVLELGKVYIVGDKAVHVVKAASDGRPRPTPGQQQQPQKYEIKVMELG
jgi:hypothetical protein